MKVLKLLKTAFGKNLLKNTKKHRQFSRVHGTNIIEKQRFCCGWLAAGDMWPGYMPLATPYDGHFWIKRQDETRDSTEWRDLRGFMRRNNPHRQEAAYEFEDTALAAKENKNCIYK